MKLSDVENFYVFLLEELEDFDFQLYNEYYIDHKGMGEVNFYIPSDDEEKFHINYASKNDTFISLYKTEGNFRDYMFSFVYVKEKGEWRLNLFHSSLYDINEKSVLGWFEEAKKLY